MAKKIPQIRTSNIFFFIPQIGIILFIVLIFWLLKIPQYHFLAVSFYFLLSIYLKVLIPKWHRKGIFHIKKGKLQTAIVAFERSYDYFRKNKWIDQYRAFTLFSTSSISYAEMALINIIYCYEQLGDKNMAQKFHQILKENFPENRFSK